MLYKWYYRDFNKGKWRLFGTEKNLATLKKSVNHFAGIGAHPGRYNDQKIVNSHKKTIYETIDQKIVIDLPEVKSDNKIQLLPGVDLNVKEVSYMCDGEGFNPYGTKIKAYLLVSSNTHDKDKYLLFIPTFGDAPHGNFAVCDKVCKDVYTASDDTNVPYKEKSI